MGGAVPPSPITSTTVNPGNPAQRFVPANSVVVNVAEPPEHPDQVNRLPNADASYGAYGWTTEVSGHLMLTETPTGHDTRQLPADRRGAIASGIVGDITVVDATHIEVVPALTAAALGFPDGMTEVDVVTGYYRVAIERVPELLIGGSLPIAWDVVTTPAVGAPAGTPWLLEAVDVGDVVLSPGTITPPANGYVVNYGSYFRVEWDQIEATETDVRTTVRSARMGCVAGDTIRANLQLLGQPVRLDTGATITNATRQIWFNYWKADGSFLSQQVGSAATIGAGITTPSYSPGVVPAGAAQVTLNVRFVWPLDAASSVETRFARPLVQMGAAPSLVEEWPTMRNIFDTSSTLTYERRAMDSSSYELVTSDPAYDPAVSTLIRKGARVEAYVALNNDPTGAGNLERLFTAKVDTVAAEYPRHNGIPKPIITITFDDGMADLASTPRAGGYADLVNLPNVLEGGIVPWNVTGQTSQSAAANVPDWTNENASALDQVAITRDTHHAYAWLDKWGVFNVHELGPGFDTADTRTWSVDEGNFSGTAVPELSTDDLINTVMITALRQIGDQTEEWKYGPYEDRTSIDIYGQRAATFTVGVPIGDVVDATYFDSFVATIFEKNAAPYKGYRVLPFSIDGNYNPLLFATVDLCDELLTTSADTGLVDEPFRVSALKHTITGRTWLLELETTTPESVASPTTQPDLKSSRAGDWTDIPLRAGFTGVAGETPQYQVTGNVVWLRGRVQGSHTTLNSAVGDLPADLAPGSSNELWASILNANVPARFFVSSSAVLNINVATAGSGSVSISTSYLRK